MKKILLFVILMVLSSNAFADKFWVGGTGNSNDPTNHWATTTGGSPGAGNTPTASDNCIFDASSGAGTATINAALACRSLQTAGSSVATIVHNSAVTVTLGDATAALTNKALDLSGLTTYTLGSVTTSAYSFVSTSSTQQTLNFGGFNIGNMTFTGASQNYAFVSNLTTDATTTVTFTGGASAALHFDGAADTLGLTHSIGKFSSNNSNVRTIALGNSAKTITGTGTVWDIGTSANATLTEGASGTVTTTGNAAIFAAGGTNCVYHSITIAIGTGTETNGGTFAQVNSQNATTAILAVTGQAGPDDRFVLGTINSPAKFTITSSFTVNGAVSNSARITVWPSSQANPAAITVSGATVSATYADFQDINFTSSTNIDFTASTGASAVGDTGGNTITGGGTLTFLTPTTQHYTSTSGNKNWSDVTVWTSRIPLAQDNVVMDAAFSGTPVITADRKWLCRNMDWTGGTGNVTLQGSGVTASERYITGSFIGKSSLTWSGNSSTWFFAVRSAANFTDNSTTESSISAIKIAAGNGGSFTWLDDANMQGELIFYGGPINFNGHNITASIILFQSGNAGNATTWNIGSGTPTLNGTGTILGPQSGTESTNYPFTTINSQTSTILISNTSSSSKTFKGGTFHWHNLSISGGGSGAVIFSDGSTWDGLPQITGGTKTLTYTAGTTNTFTGTGDETFGNGSNVITINSSSGGSAATLSKSSGFVRGTSFSIQDSAATGGASWFDANGTNVSGNSGWIFRSPLLASIGGKVQFGGVKIGY